MSWYTDLPSDWQTELGKKTGAKINIEVFYDPDGQNLQLNMKHDIVDISPVMNERDLDIEWIGRNTVYDMMLTFHDPDDYFNPTNSASPFYNCSGELYRDHVAGEYVLQLLDKSGVSFTADQVVRIADETNSQDLIVGGFTAASGSTYYHEISLNEALSYKFSKHTRVFARPNEKTEILVRLNMTGCTSKVTCFRGRLLKDPECSSGKAMLTLVDIKKYSLDEEVIGADTSSTNKLKCMNTSGTLADSVTYSSGAGVTLDRAEVEVLNNAKLRKWVATFLSATTFTLACSDFGIGITGQTDLETKAVLSGITHPFYFDYIWSIVTYKNYALIATGNISGTVEEEVIIIDISNPEVPEYYGRFGGRGSPNYMYGIRAMTVNDNYLYMAAVSDEMFVIYDISDINNPTIVGSLAGVCSSTDIEAKIVIQDNYAYLTSYTDDALYIIDITDKTNPTLTGTFSGAGSPNYMNEPRRGLAVSGNYAYVFANDTGGALVIIDISSKSSPVLADVLVHGIDPPGNQLLGVGNVVVNGDYAYTITSQFDMLLTVWDISDPTNVTYVASLGGAGAPNYMSSARQAIYRGNRIYVISYTDSALTIFDVSDSTNPIHVDVLTGAGNPTYLDDAYVFVLYGDYALVGTLASGDKSLTIVRITTSDTETVGHESIRIPADAWGGSPATGETVTFVSAINFDTQNVVQVLYDLYVDYAEIDNNLLKCSSYFGNKNIGKLRFGYEAGETAIDVAISVPSLIKTGETLTITEGSTTEDITVATGVTTTTQYPPYISLTVSALVNTYTSAAIVTWKQRATLDTDFNWDAEYDYCDKQGYNISLSIDRQMSYLQAIEDVCRNSDCFTFADNWGVEKIHTFRPRYLTSTPTLAKNTNLVQPDPTLENFPLVNEITIVYGYDHINDQYLYQYVYPESLATNKSYIKYGFVRNKTIYLPGVWTEAYAKLIAMRKYFMWENGLQGVRFNTSMQGLLFTIGDRVTIDSDDPLLNTELEIIGITGIQYAGNLAFGFIGYDAEFIWNNYFLINSSGIATGRVLA